MRRFTSLIAGLMLAGSVSSVAFAADDDADTSSPFEEGQSSEGDECRDNSDCFPSSMYYCLNGSCVWRSDPTQRCWNDFDCGFPNRCVNGQCEAR